MKLTSYKALIALVLMFVAVSLSAITYSWLSQVKDIEGEARLGELEASLEVTVNKTAYNKVVDALSKDTCYNMQKKVLEFNGIDKRFEDDGENKYFIEEISINVKADAKVASYLRVKVETEWFVTRRYNSFSRVQQFVKEKETLFPFTMLDASGNKETAENVNSIKWYYDSATDYVYYADIIGQGESLTIPFVSGAEAYVPTTSRHFYDECTAYVNIVVEMVQANRYQQVWGITEYPRRENYEG